MVGATLTNTANPTVLNAGYKVNVVPQVATALVDGRFLPGYEEEFFVELDSLLGPEVQREFVHHDIAVETTLDGELATAMTAALLGQDPDRPGGSVLPVRRHRREVVQQAGHQVLRLRATPAARRSRLRGHVPRRG